jgi:hypothetical protein
LVEEFLHGVDHCAPRTAHRAPRTAHRAPRTPRGVERAREGERGRESMSISPPPFSAHPQTPAFPAHRSTLNAHPPPPIPATSFPLCPCPRGQSYFFNGNLNETLWKFRK